jgi:hypothetical protein
MVFYSKCAFDQIGDPLCCPQLCSVAMIHGSWSVKAIAQKQVGGELLLERSAPSKNAVR